MKLYNFALQILSILSLSILPSCKGSNENLITAGEYAWNDVDDAISDKASELCKSYASDPQSLYSGSEADFISLLDNFTLTIPLDRTTHLAAGLIFGDDAADFMSTVDTYSRNKKNKQDAKKDLLDHFNGSWATLMTSLIILDGELSYELETDDLLNPSFDFDSKNLYEILNDKEYFNGVYGDDIPKPKQQE